MHLTTDNMQPYVRIVGKLSHKNLQEYICNERVCRNDDNLSRLYTITIQGYDYLSTVIYLRCSERRRHKNHHITAHKEHLNFPSVCLQENEFN